MGEVAGSARSVGSRGSKKGAKRTGKKPGKKPNGSKTGGGAAAPEEGPKGGRAVSERSPVTGFIRLLGQPARRWYLLTCLPAASAPAKTRKVDPPAAGTCARSLAAPSLYRVSIDLQGFSCA